MGVSIYYSASRPVPLSAEESAEVERIVEDRNARFRYDYELLEFYDDDDDDDDDALLRGSVKLPPGPIKSMRAMRHWCSALSAVRRAVPGSEWSVHLDGSPIPWDERTGFGGYGAAR